MSLFTMPIAEITFDDVVLFCNKGTKEGVSLDYKRDFPDDLAKSICAFANTWGGLIIIGVAEDKKSNKPATYEGIDFERGLSEKVMGKILDSISPPVLDVEIQVCDPVKDKTFVLIRIHESNQTPHAIRNSTRAYIRTGDRNNPEELADIANLEWLQNRREKSESLRRDLLSGAETRYRLLLQDHTAPPGQLTLYFCPLYPRKQIVEIEGVADAIRESRVKDAYYAFPVERHNFRPIKNGAMSFDKEYQQYFEATTFGSIYSKLMVGRAESGDRFIYAQMVLAHVDLALAMIANFYRRLGYWGNVEIMITLDGLLGAYVQMTGGSAEQHIIGKTDSNLHWRFEQTQTVLDNDLARQDWLVDFGKQLDWALGRRTTDSEIINSFKTRKRWIDG